MNWLFAWRYLKSKKSTAAVNIIAWVGVLAIAFGTAALVIIFSVFNGFEKLVKDLYSNFYAEVRITPAKGKTLPAHDSLLNIIKSNNQVTYISRYIEENALAIYGDYQHIVVAKGVDSVYPQVSGLSKAVSSGSYETGDAEKAFCVIGAGVENALGINADKALSPLTMYLPKTQAAEKLQTMDLDNLAADNVSTTGVFRIQQDFDSRYLVTNIAFMQRMMGYDSITCTGLELAINEPKNAMQMVNDLQQKLGAAYKVEDRYMQNKNLYNVMRNEKWMIYAVLVLILIISAFTITGALTMLIVEKKRDTQILFAMGLSQGRLARIFLQTGLVMTFTGALIGLFIGLGFCWLQQQYHIIALEGESFIIDYYPVKILVPDILIAVLTIAIIAFAASWYPARKLKSTSFQVKTY
jgi:lipoprotein-releasing system permease protein